MKSAKIFLAVFILTGIAYNMEMELNLRAGWNLVSVPIDSVMESDFSDVVFPVYVYDSTGTYRDFTDFSSSLLPCYGYWVLATEDHEVTLSGDLDSCIYYPDIGRGWNMLGAPHAVIHADSMMGYFTPDGFVPPVFGFDSDRRDYEERSILREGEGYWFLADTGMTTSMCIEGYQSGTLLFEQGVGGSNPLAPTLSYTLFL